MNHSFDHHGGRDPMHGTYTPRRVKRNRTLTKILLILIVLTIVTVLALGILLVVRIAQPSSPTPPVNTPSTTLPQTPDTSTEPSSSTSSEATPPITTVPGTDPVPSTMPATTPPSTTGPASPVSSPVLLPETPDAGQSYLDKIVFLGDSTTYHMFHYSDLKPAQIWSPLSGTLALDDIKSKKIAFPEDSKKYTEWTEILISDALRSRQPEILIVTLGINYAAFGNSSWDDAKKETYFKLQIRNLIDMTKENSPNTKLIFQTIYPTIDSLVGPAQKNAEVDRRNRWILEVCEETGTPMLWSIDTLRDSTGNMIAEYNSYHQDGIHMYKNGYSAVLNYIRTHAVQ
ncbi:MAG: GDSL-type esterase/lipase family protein [Eubacteriales bacterium]|nr:GDSL-type esterase/lipase family protein [Eubacteriales bacterium]